MFMNKKVKSLIRREMRGCYEVLCGGEKQITSKAVEIMLAEKLVGLSGGKWEQNRVEKINS